MIMRFVVVVAAFGWLYAAYLVAQIVMGVPA